MRWIAIPAVAIAVTGCGPEREPIEPDHARISVDIEPEGDARLHVSANEEDSDRLPVVVDEAGGALLAADTISEMVAGDDVVPYVRAEATDAYLPGRSPRVTLATERLGQALIDEGFAGIELEVCGPDVPKRFDSDVGAFLRGNNCASWDVESGDAWPTIEVAMTPQPLRWWGEVALVVVALACSVRGLTLRRGRPSRRHRQQVLRLAFVGIGACAVAVITGAAVQGDNLGVAGQLHGLALGLATEAPAVGVLVGVVCLGLIGSCLNPSGPWSKGGVDGRAAAVGT